MLVWREGMLLWPAELLGIVSEPCRIKSIDKTNDQEFNISCSGEGENAVTDYIELLITNGFTETYRMEDGGGNRFG